MDEIAWRVAMLNTLGCLVQQLSERGHLDVAAMVERMQRLAAEMRERPNSVAAADMMHAISEHLLKSDEPFSPRG